jgi:magnesium transporter
MENQLELNQKTIEDLELRILEMGPLEAVEELQRQSPETILLLLPRLNPVIVQDILDHFKPTEREQIMAAVPEEMRLQWSRNHSYPEGTVGRLMEPPVAVFRPETTVAETIDQLREMIKTSFITYGFVVDAAGTLVGVVVMRDLLFAEQNMTLNDVMVRDPFFLKPDMELAEAMKAVVVRHYPVYPVCDDRGRLIGKVRGVTLFEEQAFEISAQPGSMVGVEKEERLSTPWPRSLKFRHPWLQLNLVTAFLAGGVVSFFQNTIDELVILAVFLPILAGQSGNTGCQALAVALRGLTLGDLKAGQEKRLVFKEALLGFLNGALVGVSASIGMFILATIQNNPSRFSLSLIVLVAMIGSCVASGISGAIVPLTLKKLGADPATASSIFLTTATDVVSMGTLLGLATIFLR